MGWDFNSDTSLEALAAWEAYRELPLNTSWVGATEQDAFTAGFDAAMLPRIEKPKVQLPTTPGHYLDRTGDHWRLFPTGDWRFPSDDRYDNRAIQFAPFTLLRPVAEVVAEVLAEVRAATNATAGCETREALDGVAAKWATK